MKYVCAQRRIQACSTCSAKQGPLKKGALRARECRTTVQHFLACEGPFMACCETKSSLGAARHSLAQAYITRLSNSESRISNQVVRAAKLRTVVTLNSRYVFVHQCRNIYISLGHHILPNTVQTGLNVALCEQAVPACRAPTSSGHRCSTLPADFLIFAPDHVHDLHNLLLHLDVFTQI